MIRFLKDLTLDPLPTGACCKISCSSLAGDGMNPISQFSFTLHLPWVSRQFYDLAMDGVAFRFSIITKTIIINPINPKTPFTPLPKNQGEEQRFFRSYCSFSGLLDTKPNPSVVDHRFRFWHSLAFCQLSVPKLK